MCRTTACSAETRTKRAVRHERCASPRASIGSHCRLANEITSPKDNCAYPRRYRRARKVSIRPPDRPPPRRAPGKPAGVTRRQPSPPLSTKPCAVEHRDAIGIERPAGERLVTRRVDALGEAKPHQQEFVGALLGGEQVVGDLCRGRAIRPASARLRAASRSWWRGGGRRCRAGRARRGRCRRIRARASRPGCAGTRRRAARGWTPRRPAGRRCAQISCVRS